MSIIPYKRCMHIFHGNRLWVDPEWETRLAEIGVREGKDWTRLASKDPVSASYTTTNNYRFTLSNNETIYFKRYVYRRFRLKYWLQPSKAAIESAGYHDLKNLGIDTLCPVAYGEKRRFGLLRASFIATPEIPDTIELGHYLARQWMGLPYQEKKQVLDRLQPKLISQLQAAHAAGFFHWDLKLRNILLRKDNSNTQLFWIDCPRSRFRAPHYRKAVLTDLVAMARAGLRVLTPGQRLRFLIEYAKGDISRAKQLYRDIAKAQEKKPPRPYWELLAKDHPLRMAGMKKRGKL